MEEGVTTTLPFINLVNESVDESLLRVIPLATAEKFQVVAFADDGAHLKIAVVHPERLKPGFMSTLKIVGERVQREIMLYRTDAASLRAVLRQAKPQELPQPAKGVAVELPPLPKIAVSTPASSPFAAEKNPFAGQVSSGGVQAKVLDPRPTTQTAEKSEKVSDGAAASSPSPATSDLPPLPEPPKAERVEPKPSMWPMAPEPPLFQVDTLVAYNYLRRVPLPFAKRERIACVDHLPPSTYWFVTDGSNDRRLVPSVRYISEKNGIVAHVKVLPKETFDRLLDYYERVQEEEDKGAIAEALERNAGDDNAEAEITASLTAMSAPGPVQESGITTPDIHAKIVLEEEEKKGLAGFIQRVSHNFSASEIADTVEYEPAVVVTVPPPKPASPDASLLQDQKKLESKPQQSGALSEQDDIGKALVDQVVTIDQLKDLIREGNVPKMVAAIVSFAISEKASDIHLEPFEDEVRVRYRVDGILMDILKLPPDVQSPLVSRIKILARLRLDENRVPQDGRFEVKFDEKRQVDIRVSVMPTANGEKVVMRLLDKSRGITSIEDLGIEGEGYQMLTQSIQKPYGICLATGPTGSGKSTTLYAILQRIATPNVNVVTLEDPIEFDLKGVNQSQIRPKIGFTFAEGLRSILRQDPNIIMVGEIRDGETANMATQAALTGHLVLSTLHTNDAAGAIPRLTNMGIEPFLITSSLNMVLAQRLVRKICPHCKQPVNLPAGVKAGLEADIEEAARISAKDASRVRRPITFYQGVGCDKCHGRGYLGRVGIYEVLIMNDEIEELTVKRASGMEIQAAAKRQGMITLYQDGLLKAANGITTIDEVLREAKAS